MKRTFSFVSVFATALLAVFLWPAPVKAATLSFSAPAVVSIGEMFPLNVFIDSRDRGFNAAEVTLLFPNDVLEVVSADAPPSSTIFNFWLSPPSFSNQHGTLTFSGGTTRGVLGPAVQVFTVLMRAKGSGEAIITASDASVNASDGSGANILEIINTLRVTVTEAPVAVPGKIEPAPQPKPQPSAEPESKDLQKKSEAPFMLFANRELIFPTIEKVSILPHQQTWFGVFVSGVAEEGSHVHLLLRRNGVLYKEITVIIDADRKWEGTFANIFSYGIYSIDAVAENGPSRESSQPTTWTDVHLSPQYSLALFGFTLHWYFVADALLALFVLAFGVFLARRHFIFRERARSALHGALAFSFLVAVFIGMLIATYFFWKGEHDPETKFWKDTSIPCIHQQHSFYDVYSAVRLTVFIDKVPQKIPADIGVSPQCVAQIHSHDDTGHLHFEPAGQGVTLPDFFAVAKETIEREGYTLSVTVNGEDFTDRIGTYILQNNDAVVVTYTTIPPKSTKKR